MCLLANSQTQFQNEDKKNLWFVYRSQRDKHPCSSAYKIRSSYTEEIGFILSQQKKFIEKD